MENTQLQLKNFLKDREEILKDAERKDEKSFKDFKKIVEEIKEREIRALLHAKEDLNLDKYLDK